MLPEHQTLLLTRRFQEQLRSIGLRYSAATTTAFVELGRYDDEDINKFVDRLAPQTTAARRTAVAAATAYFSTLAQLRAPAVNFEDIEVPDESRDPFIAMRTSLKRGNDFDIALAAGAARAGAIARNLVVSSGRRTGDVVLGRLNVRVQFWRRAPDGNACEWCHGQTEYQFASSADADYGHDRCGCTPQPVAS